MNIQQYLDEMKKVQNYLLKFIEDEENEEENLENLQTLLSDQKILDDRHKFKSLLYLLASISNNHQRKPNFFSKIERIFIFIKKWIQKFFSNYEIFSIFKSNKRILMFLLDEQIIIIDDRIAKKFMNEFEFKNYPQYFSPEMKPYLNEDWFSKSNKFLKIDEKIPDNFYELRKIGENETEICKKIREDSVKEFIVYISQNNIPLEGKIQPTIYETNYFLLKRNEVSLIEYAAFFGSIQIFKYLQINGVELRPELWLFAIHSKNSELIKELEDLQVILENKELIEESIKCHHNDIVNYFLNNYSLKEEINSQYISNVCLQYHNYDFIQYNYIDETSFIYLCIFDYYIFVEILLKTQNIDINKQDIFFNISMISQIKLLMTLYIKSSMELINNFIIQHCISQYITKTLKLSNFYYQYKILMLIF